MNQRTTCEGTFTLPLDAEAAAPLFTPEGERRWAGSAWDPVYPVPGAAADDSAPGTVFTTKSDGPVAVWVVIGRGDTHIAYARVTPGRFAGTISVSCVPRPSPDSCEVTVKYDVTSLGPDGLPFVHELQADYAGFLESWREEILAALMAEGDRPD